MTLTANQIRCLLAVLALARMEEDVASKDVAKLLGVSKPSVHKALDILVDKGLLEKKPYSTSRLTQSGHDLAVRLEARKERLFLLFSQTYGLSLDESSLAATVLLSSLKDESLDKLDSAVQITS